MTAGYPPPPTLRHIIAGLALSVLACLMLLSLATIVKDAGAAFIFLPAKLGIIQVASPGEIIPVDMSTSPTLIQILKPGWYLLYTDNYDLLVINDAVVESRDKPWFNLEAENGKIPRVDLIARGLTFYDTPLAKGRPVARIEFPAPGYYTFLHPRRPVLAHLVPDYITGNESRFILIALLELALLAYAGWRVRKRLILKKNLKTQEKF